MEFRSYKKKKLKKVKQNKLQSTWESRIAEAEDKKELWKQQFEVDSLYSAYEGRQCPADWTEDKWFTINLIFQSMKILKRNVCPRRLEAKVKLTRSFLVEPEQIASLEGVMKVRQAVLNYLITRLSLYKEGQQAYMNAGWQFGVVKVGYSATMEDNPNAGGVVFDKETQEPMYTEMLDPMIEPDMVTTDEEFFIDWVDPDCFIVDRYCKNDLDKSGRFCAQKIFTSLEEVKASALYKPSVTAELGASHIEEPEKEALGRARSMRSSWSTGEGDALPENEIVVLYEIYDLINKETLTIARGGEKPLRGPMDLPDGVSLHPYITLKLNERKGEWYPVPYIYNWMGPSMEYNLTRNQIATHRKRFNRKYLYLDGYIEQDQLDILEEGLDGTYAKALQPGALEVVKDAPLDNAVYGDTSMLRHEFDKMVGLGQNQHGTTGAESATEAEIVERRAREGEGDDHEIVMAFLGEVIKKLHDCVEGNLTQEGAVEYVGPAGASWISFGPDNFKQIEGEMLFTISAEEEARMTLQVERSQLLEFIDIIGRNPMIALSQTLMRAVADKFPGLKDNTLLIQEIQQLAVMQLQMQMQEMKAKASKGQTKTGETASSSRQVRSK